MENSWSINTRNSYMSLKNNIMVPGLAKIACLDFYCMIIVVSAVLLLES